MDRNEIDLIAIAAGSATMMIGAARAVSKGFHGPAWLSAVAAVVMLVALLLSPHTLTHPILIGISVVSLAIAAVLFFRMSRHSSA